MAIPFHKRINSIESTYSTIQNDSHTSHWFAMFISHPSIKERLKNSASDQRNYLILQKIKIYTGLLYLLTFTLIVIVYLTKQKIWLVIGIPLLLANYYLSRLNSKTVANISRSILLEDFEKIKLETQTIYQICEYYGKMLSIPTLVDIITRQDSILRKTVIYSFILSLFIYLPDLYSDWAIIFAPFFVMHLVINTPIVFKKLK